MPRPPMQGPERLASAVEQAARLAAANDDLASANRALIEAASGEGDMIEPPASRWRRKSKPCARPARLKSRNLAISWAN